MRQMERFEPMDVVAEFCVVKIPGPALSTVTELLFVQVTPEFTVSAPLPTACRQSPH